MLLFKKSWIQIGSRNPGCRSWSASPPKPKRSVPVPPTPLEENSKAVHNFLRCAQTDRQTHKPYENITCFTFTSKCTKMRLVTGLCPDPLGILQRSPRPPNWIKGEGTEMKREGGEKEEEGKGKDPPPMFEVRWRPWDQKSLGWLRW